MRRRLLLPLLALFAVSCTIEVSNPDLTLGTSESMAVTIRGFYAYPPPGSYFNVNVKSSDESVVSITPEPGGGGRFTLHAKGTGTAYIVSADDPTQTYITVHVFDCVPVSIRLLASPLVVKPGSSVELRVITEGFQTESIQWYEERNGQWSYIPFSDAAVYPFTPRATGTYRFLVRNNDRCGTAETILTVVATSRGHAAPH
jgi:hypothetical protein